MCFYYHYISFYYILIVRWNISCNSSVNKMLKKIRMNFLESLLSVNQHWVCCLYRYKTVTEACSLQPDIDILPQGDQTEIGERVSVLFITTHSYTLIVDHKTLDLIQTFLFKHKMQCTNTILLHVASCCAKAWTPHLYMALYILCGNIKFTEGHVWILTHSIFCSPFSSIYLCCMSTNVAHK